MATQIILKKSSVIGAVPLSTDLEIGEVALNLADRKLYTKNNSGNVIQVGHPYVSATAPTSPAEGDLWYNTSTNSLQAYDGTDWQSAGYQTFAELEDVNLTAIAAGDHVKWNGTAFVNSNFESDVESLLTATNTGTGYGDLSYANGVYNFDRVTALDIRSEVSAVDAGGDGSFSYNSTTGVFTYTGPSAAEVRAHFSGGTGVDITNGVVSIGQPVATSDTVAFAEVQTSALTHTSGVITIDPTDNGLNTGEVIIAGNLTINGTTTTVNSNEVNIGDNIIVLNADEVGTPSQNAGIEIERGTSANVSFLWDEANDYWSLGNEELANVVIDGGTY